MQHVNSIKSSSQCMPKVIFGSGSSQDRTRASKSKVGLARRYGRAGIQAEHKQVRLGQEAALSHIVLKVLTTSAASNPREAYACSRSSRKSASAKRVAGNQDRAPSVRKRELAICSHVATLLKIRHNEDSCDSQNNYWPLQSESSSKPQPGRVQRHFKDKDRESGGKCQEHDERARH